MPKPPAGFVLDDQGRCIAAASKRIVTIVRLPIPFLSFFFLSFVLHLGMVGFCSYFFLSSQMKLSTTQLKPNQHLCSADRRHQQPPLGVHYPKSIQELAGPRLLASLPR
jgi:hypothetical protein